MRPHGPWYLQRRSGLTLRDMAAAKFDEGNTYLVHQLHILDPDGSARTVESAAVVFTPGWVFVQEAGSEGYVLPRERVLLVEGVKKPRSAEPVGIPSAELPSSW